MWNGLRYNKASNEKNADTGKGIRVSMGGTNAKGRTR